MLCLFVECFAEEETQGKHKRRQKIYHTHRLNKTYRHDDMPQLLPLRNRMLKCVLDLAQLDSDRVFWQPVSLTAFPHYTLYCERPIDLSTIFCKIMVDGYAADVANVAAVKKIGSDASNSNNNSLPVFSHASSTSTTSPSYTVLLAFEDDLVDMLLNCVCFNDKPTKYFELAVYLLAELPRILANNGIQPCRKWLHDTEGPRENSAVTSAATLFAELEQRANGHTNDDSIGSRRMYDDDDNEGDDEEVDRGSFLGATTTAARARRRARREADSVSGAPETAPFRAVQHVFFDALQRIASSPASSGALALSVLTSGSVPLSGVPLLKFDFYSSAVLLKPLRSLFSDCVRGNVVTTFQQWLDVVLSASINTADFTLSLDELYRQFQLIIAACISESREAGLVQHHPRMWSALLELRAKGAPRAFRAASDACISKKIPSSVAAPLSPTAALLRRRIESVISLWSTPDLFAEHPPPQQLLALAEAAPPLLSSSSLATTQDLERQQQAATAAAAFSSPSSNSPSAVANAVWAQLKMLVALTKERPEAEPFCFFDFSSSALIEAAVASSSTAQAVSTAKKTAAGFSSTVTGASSTSAPPVTTAVEECLHLIQYRLVRGIAPPNLLQQIAAINSTNLLVSGTTSRKRGVECINVVDVVRQELDRLVNQVAALDPSSDKAQKGSLLYRESRNFLKL